jgi:acetyltransferase-like isoleucine patch superfamily enzyme
VQFGSLFSQAGARLDESVYVGPRCHLGLVHLERDVLLGAGVHIPSGGATHGIDDLDRPIREQPGARTLVRIGEGTWVGSAAVIMADVGRHCVIGAGSVVTHQIPDYSIAAGVPARVIRSRGASTRSTVESVEDVEESVDGQGYGTTARRVIAAGR